MNILWLDDDAFPQSFKLGGVNIRPAHTCKEAEEMLSDGDLPDWIIVDLIVPQGGWGKELYELPGLEFARFVSSQYREKIQIAAFSIVMPSAIANRFHEIGVAKCYAKSTSSLTSIVEDLRQSKPQRDFTSDRALTSYETLFQEELKRTIGKLLDQLSLSTRPISEREIAELHRAKLALENDEEKRLRSYQTLEALNDHVETVVQKTTQDQQEELTQLRNTVELIINHKRAHRIFDVFLSYNSADIEEVETIAVALKANAILPWFDKWEIKPGDRWQKQLAAQIENVRCAAVFLGKSGVGPWHEQEIEAFLMEFQRRKCPVIPVLLPSAGSEQILPVFLRGASCVDFRQPNPDSLQRLIWAIIN